MLDKIKSVVAKVSPVVSKAVALAPLPMGIAIGYIGHPFIKLSIDAISIVVKSIIG